MKFWHVAALLSLYCVLIGSLDPWRPEAGWWLTSAFIALVFCVVSYHNDRSI